MSTKEVAAAGAELNQAAARYKLLLSEFFAARRIDRDKAEDELWPALEEAKNAEYRAAGRHAEACKRAGITGLHIGL